MEDQRPSRTAMVVALIRADHARKSQSPLLNDFWAEKLIPAEFVAELPRFASSDAELEQWLARGGLRVNVILRARYCEDQLREAVRGGVGQYVIVGAGFDSLAWRRPQWAQGLAIFELDHPATQNLKVKQLRAAGADLDQASFIAVDLRDVAIDQALAPSAYDPERPAFFAWLGVTRYLTREANAAALAAMGRAAAAGSRLVLSYAPATSSRAIESGEDEDRSKATLASWGEPWVSSFTQAEMAQMVGEAGFQVAEDLSHEDLVARYKNQGAEALGRASNGRLMLAVRV